MFNRKYVLRFSFVFLSLLFGLLAFSVRLVLIQVFRSSHLAQLAQKQHNHLIDIEPVRGSIYDRQMRPLAFNISVDSLFANTRDMSEEDKQKAVKYLPELLEMDAKTLRDRLSKEKYFVWLKRKLNPEISQKVRGLKIKGLGFRKESKRFYPNGSLSAHIIGFAGIDNNGLEGLELAYDEELKGRAGRMRILRDAKQRELWFEDDFMPARNGQNLVLTIDETIQYIAEQALQKALIKDKAKAATIIVMDVRTGEILALANQPTYRLDRVTDSDVASRTNRALSFMYEPGSVFKIVAASAALEEGAFKETDQIFCENGEYRVANHILHDHNPHGRLSFAEVFQYSSNIGVTKVAQKLGPDMIYKYAQRFHFGEKTGIDMKGEVEGILKPPSKWSKVSISAIPIGQEITATPLQLVCALSSIANGGVYMQPYIVKSINDEHGVEIKSVHPRVVSRVIEPETARRVSEILADTVEKGTGKLAQIKGMRVAGKTGTAQKVVDGQYSHRYYYATFMGYAPVDNPRLAAIVVFDEPYPRYFGGTVAAPVFKEVIENSLKYLETVSTTSPNASLDLVQQY